MGHWSQPAASSCQLFPLGFFLPDGYLIIPHKPVLGLWLEPSLSLKSLAEQLTSQYNITPRGQPAQVVHF